jgi:arylsulfatase A-like enzyme
MPTLAQPLKAAGYHTAYFGKWHLDGYHERNGRAAMHITDPGRRGGFDEWVGFENNNNQWDCWVHGGEGDEAFHHRLEGYETDRLTDLLIDYLHSQGGTGQEDRGGEDSGQPFFAVLSVQPPHNPYLAPEEFMAEHNPAQTILRPNVPPVPRVQEKARRELAGYYAQIENLDWNVGRIRQTLDDLGLSDDTYVVFFSDHGDLHGSHGQFRKTAAWEESLRIPFIVSRGETSYGHAQGEIPNVPINHVDIAPTSLGLLGLDVPDWMEGTDYSGLFQGGRDRPEYPDSAFCQEVIPTYHPDSVDRPWRAVVTTDGWKYVCFEGQPWMLFDLNEDPYEMVNLATNTLYRDRRKKLQERLADWIDRTDDTFQLPEI